jgi:predicted thioesterase
MATLAPGLRGTATGSVAADNTAIALGSGDVPVYGTPALVALMEKAAVCALGDRLGPDETTVGTWIEVNHLAATPVGLEVRAEAELVAVEGRQLSFVLTAFDSRQKIGEGRHHRALLSRERFLAKLQEEV